LAQAAVNAQRSAAMRGPGPGGPAGAGLNQAQYDAAKGMAAAGAQQAAGFAAAGAQELGAYIEKGNDGLAILAFLGNLALAVSSVIGCLNVADIILGSPIHYALNAYLLVFSTVGMVLEAQESWIEKSSHLQRAQTLIFEYAKFLTELWGRGLYYIFLASLSMAHTHIMYIVLGLYMLVCGGLTVSMHFSPETTKKVVKVGVGQLRDATGPYAAKYAPVEGDPSNQPPAY